MGQLIRPGGGKFAPDPFRRRIIMRKNLLDELPPGGGQDHAIGPAVPGAVAALKQAAGLQPVHQAGDIRSVHDEGTAQFDLRAAFGLIVKQVEHVELAGAEVPAGEEEAAGVPERLGCAQELEQGPIPGSRRWRTRAHDRMFIDKLFICQQVCRRSMCLALDSGSLVSDGSGTGISPVCRVARFARAGRPCHYAGNAVAATIPLCLSTCRTCEWLNTCMASRHQNCPRTDTVLRYRSDQQI